LASFLSSSFVGAATRQRDWKRNQFFDSNSSRANVILPSGSGKTLLALTTIVALANSHQVAGRAIRVIIVVPTLKLCDQVLDTLDDPYYDVLKGVPLRRLIVASQTNRKEQCTTDANKIADFLSSGGKDIPSAKILLLVCTYDSLPKVGEALMQRGGETLDIAIFDEAHVMAGNGERSGYGLDDKLLPVHLRLFMTATPRLFEETVSEVTVTGSRIAKDGSNVLIPKRGEPSRTTTKARSFDDESLFGPCVYRLTNSESVEQGYCGPFDIICHQQSRGGFVAWYRCGFDRF
jgi:predicted helicase